jgi:hypothetical protein
LIFRFEVLTDDAVFLDRVLRERIAAARVLSGDAAAGEIVLEARAVDEQVDGVRRLPTGLDGPEVGAVDPVFAHCHARRESGELEKVATRRRQFVDLILRDVRRDFRRSRLGRGRGGDNHALQLRRGAGEREVLDLHRADLDDDASRLWRRPDAAHGEIVCRGHETGEHEAPIGTRGGAALRAGFDIARRDLRVGDRRTARAGHSAAHRARGILRGRSGANHAQQQSGERSDPARRHTTLLDHTDFLPVG